MVDKAREHADGQPDVEQAPSLATLLDNLPGMAYRCLQDAYWTMRLVSAGAIELTGYTPEDLVDNRSIAYVELIHPDDRARVEAIVRRAVESGQRFQATYRLRTADGTEKWVWEQGKAVGLEDGTAVIEGYVTDITSQRRTEEALRASESRLRMIFASEPECVKVVSADGRLREMNPAGLRMLEADDASQVLERPISSLLHPDDRDAYLRLHRTVCQGSHGELQFRIIGLKGTIRWVETHAVPLRDASGAIVSVLSVTRDISERRRNEKQRATERHVLEMVSAGAPLAGILDTIARGVEEIMPAARASILLLDAEGQHLRHGAAPSLPAEYNRAIDGAPIGPSAGSCGTAAWRRAPVVVADILTDPLWADYRHLAESFGLRACWSMPVMDRTGKVLATVAVYYDHPRAPEPQDIELVSQVSHLIGIAVEHDRKEQALRASEERFRYVAQATADAIWDWDLGTDAIWWSSGMRTLFGHDLATLEPDSTSWTSRIHPEDKDAVLVSIKDAIAGNARQWEASYRFLRSDGSYATVVDRGFVIRDAQGTAIRMVGGMTDVTERLALEERLRQSQRMESVGQLTGGVAHDFNNLLTVILGNAELLSDELVADARQRMLAEMIASAAQRGAELTQRLLAFARRQALEPKITDINRLVAGMDGLLRRALGEQVEIEVIRGAGLWPALVDAGQLENALLNLCLNARDAMPRGGRLTIETANAHLTHDYTSQYPELRPGQYVMLAVSDTGTGIAPEHLRRVFEPFFTTKEKGKGTGLGLSMVYGFIKQTGGHVNIYSEPGQGTTVRMYLPRTTGTVQAEDSEHGSPDTHSGSATILLVEDDELVRRYAQDQLTSLGYAVIVAENGALALDILRERPDIDLLFTDVIMPGGMSGRQLADAARELRPSLKVLYTSGYTENAIVHHGRLDPGVELLGKPYRRSDLAHKIRQVLDKK